MDERITLRFQRYLLKVHQNKDSATLTDRFAVAFLSILLAFLTGLLVWLVAVRVFMVVVPFNDVLALTGFASVLGFLFLENIVLRILAIACKFLDYIFRCISLILSFGSEASCIRY